MSDELSVRCVASAQDEDPAKDAAYWQLTPKNQCDTVTIFVDRRKIIPVLFLPGIMGTNLKNKKLGGDPVWSPPNNIFSGIVTLLEYLGKNASRRAAELDPDATQVDDGGTINNAPLLESHEAQHIRHWGEIYSKCYHPFMARLQSRLNRVYSEHTFSGKRPLVNNWEEMLKHDPLLSGQVTQKGALVKPCLTQAELDHINHFRFEVWAGGYNWLQSNAKSAEAIERRIDEIIGFYKEGLLATKKVLIITHSMGGLVARALVQQLKDEAQNKILGVIHGAMPANGAAETYANMRQGIKGLMGYVVGKDAEQVTAVLGYAQGGLELLPFGGRYCMEETLGVPWLYFKENGNGKYLPTGDNPYDEIYKEKKWYGLIPSANEAKIPKKQTAPEEDAEKTRLTFREKFEFLIRDVKKFHEIIRGKYFPDTFAFWGCDDALPAVGAVSWDAMPLGKKPAHPQDITDTGKGAAFDGARWCKLVEHKNPGDGTVPYASWKKDRALPRMTFLHGKAKQPALSGTAGYEHQAAFNDERALWVSLYGAVKLVSEKVPLPGK